MCEANAYLLKEGKESLLMESVDIIKPDNSNNLSLTNIFGNKITIKGKIKRINLVDHKILVQEEHI